MKFKSIVTVTVVVLMVTGGMCFAKSALMDKLVSEIDSNSGATELMKAFIKAELLPLSTNSVFVSEVKAQNAKGISINEIKRIDKQWIEAEDELPVHSEILNNVCSRELKKVIRTNSAIIEAFVMDNQGAVVGETNLTSDYWQGDEAKWTDSYRNGSGGVSIGKEKYDKSAGTKLQQVSLPIIDEDGNVIGAVTYGISTQRL